MATPKQQWYPSLKNQVVEFATQTKFNYLELHRPSTAPKIEGILDDASLEGWLEKDPALTSGEDQPCNSLRLLIGTCGLNSSRNAPETSISNESFAMIKDQLGLPDHYLSNIPSNHIIRTSSFSSHKDCTQLLGLIFKLPFYREKFYQISITHSLKSRITYGLILAQNLHILTPLLSRLESQFHNPYSHPHPLLLPLVAIELELERINERLHTSDQNINELEETMGQHEYSDRPSGNPLHMDFTAATRRLNYISKRVGVDTLNLGFIELGLGTVESWGVATQIEDQELQGGIMSEDMKQKTIWLKDTCRSLLLLAEYEDKRTKTLVQVVYQFMAQKDTHVNLELAKSSAQIAKASKDDSAAMREMAIESKRDSSAMKTIAVLGMFFLPGTFVAAIFAMPVFNWDGDEDGERPLVKEGFKYYWAVALPLTSFVLGIWALATRVPWRKWRETSGV